VVRCNAQIRLFCAPTRKCLFEALPGLFLTGDVRPAEGVPLTGIHDQVRRTSPKEVTLYDGHGGSIKASWHSVMSSGWVIRDF